MKPARAPPPRTVGLMLDGIPTLAGLLSGHRRSYACFTLIAPCLPELLVTQIRPGPIDDKGWTLFAAHGGAAAKLRQALPSLLEALAAGGENIAEIRVKVLPPADPGGAEPLPG